MENHTNPLSDVKAHYEHYPYPHRDPADEKNRLIEITLDKLAQINFYCFKGKQSFNSNFRVLIAGGGTGDSTIFLAEQLRHYNAEIVYSDLSAASMKIAQERAKIRKLNNITWINDSLLALPDLALEPFDYINCGGVLHYLDEAYNRRLLFTLKSLLKPEGSMGMMVYAQYGRTGVYQMQQLMRLLNAGTQDMSAKLANTRSILEILPPTNWFKRAEELFAVDIEFGDVGLYDLFLHAQDRAYTVLEMYEFIESCGLHFVEFATIRRILYDPDFLTDDPTLLAIIKKLDKKQQQAVAELINGSITKHLFYVANQPDTIAALENLENVPFLAPSITVNIADLIEKQPAGEPVTVFQSNGINIIFQPGAYTQFIFKYLDGQRSLQAIFDQVRQILNKSELTNQSLLADFKPIYQRFNQLDLILLRHESVGPFATTDELQRTVFKKLGIRIKK